MNVAFFFPGFPWLSSFRKYIYMKISEAVFKTENLEKKKKKNIPAPPPNDGYIVTTEGWAKSSNIKEEQ